ncbi:MAG: epoxyqueuosine reductase QueH [Clostridia bacterium]|nr:epoxyqueuosine reductase QueH [Clostridia bacterium]
MEQKVNYGLWLEREIERIKASGKRPKLLLHACCAPCSSYVLEYLSSVFDITLYFYNPNITPCEENDFRAEELRRLCREMPLSHVPEIIVESYEPEKFYEAVKGMESMREGESRCAVCYRLRLEKTAQKAKELGVDYFTTTLSISPYKRSEWLNEIGGELMETYGVSYLFSDFKKKNGYKRSIELSHEYNLYRQDYCGCEFSKVNK